MPEREARAQVDRWIDARELTGAFPLPFDKRELAGTTVETVLADPERYINKTMADPHEGVPYGRGKAILYRRADGSLFVHSFAHGGATYELKATPKAGIKPEEVPPQSESEEILAELNRDNVVVLDGGKAWVLRFEQVAHNLNGRRYSYRVPTYLRTGDFRTLYMNRHVKIGDRLQELGLWWLKHPERRQYFGLVFEPGSEAVVDGKLNLWTGWGVEPKRGDWSLMREHIFEVLAARDEAVDAYI
jgi:hypothetical protein